MLASSYDYKNPITHHCLLYIRFLANSLKNVRSVKNYISGARTFINMIGGNPVSFSAPMTFTFLKGIANQSSHEEQEAPALPCSTLIQLCADLRTLGPDGVVAAAACLFGVTTFLRQSNFLPTGCSRSPHMLSRSDVTLDAAGMRVHVSSTKTLTPRSGGVVILVARVPGSSNCPVRCCIDAWSLAPGCPDSVLFVLPSTGRPLTTGIMTTVARRALAGRGWPSAQRFTVHSLWRTGARLAASAGATEKEVMLHGTWTSVAVRRYVPRELTSSVPAAFAAILGPDLTRS